MSRRLVSRVAVIGEADVAALLHVRDGRVVRYARFDKLQGALDAAGGTVMPVPA